METVEEYLKLADIDYDSAKILCDYEIFISCVQHCTQAVEKCLKAFVLKYSTMTDQMGRLFLCLACPPRKRMDTFGLDSLQK